VAEVRVTVRVKPGASRARVGGRYGEDALVVSVNAPPVDGAANEAVARVVAGALGLRPRQVSVLSGHTARTKVLALTIEDGTEAAVRERITDLMGA
jgi:uncharacterized protein